MMTEAPTDATTPTPAASPTTPAAIEYTPFAAPEGRELDPKAIESATAVFKELGLTQSQAQKLIDFQLSRDGELGEKSAETYNKMRADWRGQVEAHPTLGGEKLPETLATINKAIQTLPPKLQTAFKDAMTYTGAGDHPAVVEAFYALAKGVTEGSHVSGSGPSAEGQSPSGKAQRPSAAQALYPNLPSASTTH